MSRRRSRSRRRRSRRSRSSSSSSSSKSKSSMDATVPGRRMPVGAPKPARRPWAAVRRPGTGWLAVVAGKTPHHVAQTEPRR